MTAMISTQSGIGTPGHVVRLQSPHHRYVIYGDPFPPDAVWLRWSIVDEDKLSGSLNFFGAYPPFWASAQDLIASGRDAPPYQSYASKIRLPLGLEVEDTPAATRYGEHRSAPRVLSSRLSYEPESGTSWYDLVETEGISSALAELAFEFALPGISRAPFPISDQSQDASAIQFPTIHQANSTKDTRWLMRLTTLEPSWDSYGGSAGTEETIRAPDGRSSVSREPQGASTNQVLTTLQATNPEAVKRIRKLTSLRADWDGYGGDPPTEEAVREAAELLLEIHNLTQGLLVNPFIAPLPDGGLELEWDLDSGAELMLVIMPTGTDIKYLLDEPSNSNDTIESEGSVFKDATLSDLIRRLTQ